MRLLLDAMLPAKLVTPLCERGIDAIAIDGFAELEGLSDDEVLAWGRRDGRVVVTRNNKHFCERGRRAVREGDGHAGLILLAGANWSLGRLLAGLEQAAKAHPADDALRNQELWL